MANYDFLRQISVKVNDGSGVIVKPCTDEYCYVFTDLHVIEHLKKEEISVEYYVSEKDDYDEDAINEELKKLKLDSYAASVFQAMTDKTGLTEGFMPLPAKKGRKSREILKYVK